MCRLWFHRINTVSYSKFIQMELNNLIWWISSKTNLKHENWEPLNRKPLLLSFKYPHKLMKNQPYKTKKRYSLRNLPIPLSFQWYSKLFSMPNSTISKSILISKRSSVILSCYNILSIHTFYKKSFFYEFYEWLWRKHFCLPAHLIHFQSCEK